jgi:hypothetical protein
MAVNTYIYIYTYTQIKHKPEEVNRKFNKTPLRALKTANEMVQNMYFKYQFKIIYKKLTSTALAPYKFPKIVVSNLG